MGYKGIEMTSQEEYIYSDIQPYNPEFDLEELKIIQNKLQNFTSGISTDGISSYEAEVFLDWVTFNARNYATKNGPESPMTASMTGQCAPTQRINFKLLSKMGLDVRPFNTADCIGEIPVSAEDYKRIQNGWSSPAVRHSVSLVNIPIIDNNGNTQLYEFLLDPTFRQFCKKEFCNDNKFYDENYLGHGYVAPHPGYFMEAQNLEKLGASQEIAQKSEMLGKYIVSKGYFYLNEENAKLYGDAFVRASKRIEFQNIPINMSGYEYMRNFENIPMHMLEGDKNDEQYTILPSEMKENKKGLFSRFKDFFMNKFGKNKTLALSEGSRTIQKHEIEGVKLKGEEIAEYNSKVETILEKYNNKEKENTINYNEEREL